MINFNEAFKRYQVPERIRKASENICTEFNIKGICDPMYISNVIAFESGSGDGQSNFVSDEILNTLEIAKRLQGSYGCNIPKDKVNEVKEILEL